MSQQKALQDPMNVDVTEAIQCRCVNEDLCAPKACVAVTQAELRTLFVGNRPESEALVNEFVVLGLADHPDFVRFIETAVVEPANIAKHAKAKLKADRLLDNARIASQRLNCRVIAGHRCGVQSCDSEEANVYAEIEGNIYYVRIDRAKKEVTKPHYTNPAYEFVKSHFDDFEQLCASLDQARKASGVLKMPTSGASLGMRTLKFAWTNQSATDQPVKTG